jgi:hypothetical protein
MQENIGRFFQLDMRSEKKIQFLFLLGPIFLILSLYLASYGKDLPNFDLWGVVILSCLFCYKFRYTGLFISLVILFASVMIKHTIILSNHLWQFGLESSIALGITITCISFEKISSFIDDLEEKRKKLSKKLSSAEDELNKEEVHYSQLKNEYQNKIDSLIAKMEEKEAELSSVTNLFNSIKNTSQQEFLERKSLVNENIEKTKQIVLLSEKLENAPEPIETLDVINELNQSRMRQLQAQYINESLLRLFYKKQSKQQEDKNKIEEEAKQNKEITILHRKQEQELKEKEILEKQLIEFREEYKIGQKIQEEWTKERESLKKQISEIKEKREVVTTDHSKNKNIIKYEKKLNRYRRMELLYNQLKAQFESKNTTLHQTRKEVFSLQEKIYVKEQENQFLEADIDSEKNCFIDKIIELEKEIESLGGECNFLQDLLTESQKANINN